MSDTQNTQASEFTQRIHVLLTPSQETAGKERAARMGVGLSTWMRQLLIRDLEAS